MSLLTKLYNNNLKGEQNPKFLFLHLIILLLLIFIDSTFSSSLSSSLNGKNHLIKKSNGHLKPKQYYWNGSEYSGMKRIYKNLPRNSKRRNRKSSRKPRHYFEMNTNFSDQKYMNHLLNGKNEIGMPLSKISTTSNTSILTESVAEELVNNDIMIDHEKAIECSNDTMKQDFGIACLKKGLNLAPPINHLDGKLETPNFRTRYFTVKPMMIEKKDNSNGLKSPAQNARQLYVANKPLKYHSKTLMSPVNNKFNYYSPQKNPIYIQSRSPFSTNWNWNQYHENHIIQDPQIQEDLELLNSLKSSLGVLKAQAMNVKQRTMMLYREAKRRRLIFFDGLLMRTHNLISEKQDETKRAMEDIDEAINRIRQNQRSSFYLRRNQRYSAMIPRYPNGMKKPLPKSSEINQKQIDRLMLDGLNHAKHIMNTVKELNEALDEFEDQFNFPRFEPNSIDDF